MGGLPGFIGGKGALFARGIPVIRVFPCKLSPPHRFQAGAPLGDRFAAGAGERFLRRSMTPITTRTLRLATTPRPMKIGIMGDLLPDCAVGGVLLWATTGTTDGVGVGVSVGVSVGIGVSVGVGVGVGVLVGGKYG